MSHLSKKQRLAGALQTTGLLRLLEALPTRPGLLVVNHHRVGDSAASRFDRQVFSQTQDGFDEQIKLLKRRMPILNCDEMEDMLLANKPMKRMYAAITFDDGYLDNYRNAFPVLQANSCSALFFLVTSFVGSAHVPWWDEIAYLVRNSRRDRLELSTPAPLNLSPGEDREPAIRSVLLHFKREDNHSPAQFLEQLREQTGVTVPAPGRRFLSWDEAREMQQGGQFFGSHTVNHPVLSQLTGEEQARELRNSREEMEAQLGRPVRTLAYPVGTEQAFNVETERIARAAGYTVCFAYQGGVNLRGRFHRSRVRRQFVSPDRVEARCQLATLPVFGSSPV